MSQTSKTLVRAPKPLLAIGQFGGHVKSGLTTPRGERTDNPMALVSALPLSPDSDKIVLTFLDRSSPVDSFDNKPCSGDNAVIIMPRSEIMLSIIKGVCPGDWRGLKLNYGEDIEEPEDLDIDPAGLELEASDKWVDMVDELGCDCSKYGGYPLWGNGVVDVAGARQKYMRFHHRIAGDVLDLGLGDGGVVYVFVDEDGEGGAVCWQQSAGGSEQIYHHYR